MQGILESSREVGVKLDDISRRAWLVMERSQYLLERSRLLTQAQTKTVMWSRALRRGAYAPQNPPQQNAKQPDAEGLPGLETATDPLALHTAQEHGAIQAILIRYLSKRSEALQIGRELRARRLAA